MAKIPPPLVYNITRFAVDQQYTNDLARYWLQQKRGYLPFVKRPLPSDPIPDPRPDLDIWAKGCLILAARLDIGYTVTVYETGLKWRALHPDRPAPELDRHFDPDTLSAHRGTVAIMSPRGRPRRAPQPSQVSQEALSASPPAL
jgi:hypothetical protein